MLTAIRQWVIRTMMKSKGETGIVKTIPKRDLVELNTQITAQRLMENGIDPNSLKNTNQVENAIIAIENRPKIQEGIRSTPEAKVFDMEGKEIPPGSRIMGGKEVKNTTGSLMSVPNKKGLAGMEYETDAAIKTRLEKGNKETTQRIRNKKMLDDAIDNASPGFVKGDRKYNAQLVADDLAEKRFGKDFYDLDQRQQTDIYGEALDGLSDSKNLERQFMKDVDEAGGMEEFLNKNPIDDDSGDFAQGGRAGFKEGSKMTRRSFLKILGGLAAIPIVGKFLKPIKTAKGIKSVPIIKTGDVPGKPEWFDALVNKVILEGDDVTKRFATQERQVVHMKKIDDDTSVTVTQDLNDGSIIVDVDDPIRNVMGESGQDTSVQMMLKKGQADETTKGTPADEFSFTENDMRNYMDGPDDYTTEFTENTVDKMKDLTSDLGKIKSYATGKGPTMKEIVESKKRKDMVKFAEENPSEYAANRGPDFDPDYDDYASGGIARMLGE
jgi:hypothetical protein